MGYTKVACTKRAEVTKVVVVVVVLCCGLVVGCATGPHETTGTYSEWHNVEPFTVLFADQRTLQKVVEQYIRPEQVPTTFGPGGAMRPVVVRAFFHYKTRNLYCSKFDYAACGHELHHAILGDYHSHGEEIRF